MTLWAFTAIEHYSGSLSLFIAYQDLKDLCSLRLWWVIKYNFYNVFLQIQEAKLEFQKGENYLI
jgi:hypothetical protein